MDEDKLTSAGSAGKGGDQPGGNTPPEPQPAAAAPYTPEPPVQVSDDDFDMVSASVGTFQTPVTAPPAEPEPAAERDDRGQMLNEAPTSGDHESAGRSARQAADATPPARADKRSLDAREKKLKGNVDARTHELRTVEAQLAERRAELARLASTAPAPAPAALAPATAAAAPPPAEAPDPRPQYPEWADHPTEEAYNAAKKKWAEDDTAWMTRRDERLVKTVQAGLEQRLSTTAQADRERAIQSRALQQLTDARERHADWDDRQAALGKIRSKWHDPTRDGGDTTPFLTMLAKSRLRNRDDGGDILHFIGDPDNLERAQVLADLMPSTEFAVALARVKTPLIPILEHFATDAGAKEFEEMARMHPDDCKMAIGALVSRLTAVPRGSASVAPPITSATPPAKPPAGQPRVRANAAAPPGGKVDFGAWKDQEDAKELADKARAWGVPYQPNV